MIRGTLVAPDEVIAGVLVIDGDIISCVAVTCEAPDGATRITVTDAYIFPGFIDAHNHVAYNVLPHGTPPKIYQNRGRWQGERAYLEFKKPYKTLARTLMCEMVKYGELKALVSGVTTIQGTGRDYTCFLVR